MGITVADTAQMLNQALNSGQSFTGDVLQIHFLAGLLQIILQFIDVVLNILTCFFEEGLIRGVHDVGPLRPLINNREVFPAKVPKFESTRYPRVFRQVFYPLLIVAGNVI